jgi:hypothetical protein
MHCRRLIHCRSDWLAGYFDSCRVQQRTWHNAVKPTVYCETTRQFVLAVLGLQWRQPANFREVRYRATIKQL